MKRKSKQANKCENCQRIDTLHQCILYVSEIPFTSELLHNKEFHSSLSDRSVYHTSNMNALNKEPRFLPSESF